MPPAQDRAACPTPKSPTTGAHHHHDPQGQMHTRARSHLHHVCHGPTYIPDGPTYIPDTSPSPAPRAPPLKPQHGAQMHTLAHAPTHTPAQTRPPQDTQAYANDTLTGAQVHSSPSPDRGAHLPAPPLLQPHTLDSRRGPPTTEHTHTSPQHSGHGPHHLTLAHPGCGGHGLALPHPQAHHIPPNTQSHSPPITPTPHTGLRTPAACLPGEG